MSYNFQDLLQLLTNLKIIVKENKNIETAFCYFNENIKKYCIHYNPDCEIEIKELLLHELAHIIRGDLFYPDFLDENNSTDHYLWNITCDAIINYSLNFTTEKYKHKNITFPVLYETIPYNKTFTLVSKKELFEELKNQYQFIKQLFKNFMQDIQLTKDPEALKESQRIITIIYLNYPDLQKELNNKIQINKFKSFKKINVQKEVSLIKNIINLLDKLIYDYGSFIQYKKGINNRGRLTPFISKPKPFLKICLFVDISGSIEYQNELNKFISIASDSQKFVIDTYYFAEKISTNPNTITGASTLFYPCLQILEIKHYDAIIILSDFSFHDFEKCKTKENLLRKYKSRIIILLTKDYNKHIVNYFQNLTNCKIINFIQLEKI